MKEYSFTFGKYPELHKKKYNGISLEALLFDAYKDDNFSLVQIFDYYFTYENELDDTIKIPIKEFVYKRMKLLISGEINPNQLLVPLGGKPPLQRLYDNQPANKFIKLVQDTKNWTSANNKDAVKITNQRYNQNIAPTANVVQTCKTTTGTSIAISLTGNNLDSNTLAYTVVTPPKNGSLTGTVPNLIYKPNKGFNGTDSFIFTINNGIVDSVEATINIIVNVGYKTYESNKTILNQRIVKLQKVEQLLRKFYKISCCKIIDKMEIKQFVDTRHMGQYYQDIGKKLNELYE